MKLLIITQKVDKRDSVLGFFHHWIEEFSKHCSLVTVICLELGENQLPLNVKILSLGKERKRSRLSRIKNFYSYIWAERKNYDAVFIHMNEEYILLAAWWWRLTNKRVSMWRNHIVGTWKTPFAVLLSHVVYCTSPNSYTARFQKTHIVLAGTDIDKFNIKTPPPRTRGSILSIGRIDRVKNVHVLVEALKILDLRNIDFTASIIGDPSPNSQDYYQEVTTAASDLVTKGKIVFKPAIPNTRTPEAYYSHEIFVNMTNSGSLDKTILSAMASRTVVVLSNTSFRGIVPDKLIFREGDARDLAQKLETALSMSDTERASIIESFRRHAESQSLPRTVEMVLQKLER